MRVMMLHLGRLRWSPLGSPWPQGRPSLALAYKNSNMFFPRLEDSIIFSSVKKENNQTKDNINFWSVNLFPFLICKTIQCDSQLRQVILKRILNDIV